MTWLTDCLCHAHSHIHEVNLSFATQPTSPIHTDGLCILRHRFAAQYEGEGMDTRELDSQTDMTPPSAQAVSQRSDTLHPHMPQFVHRENVMEVFASSSKSPVQMDSDAVRASYHAVVPHSRWLPVQSVWCSHYHMTVDGPVRLAILLLGAPPPPW